MTRPIAAFRTDAAAHIGIGHMMRCLTLADALGDRGWRCVFVMRRLPGCPAEAQITHRGHELRILPKPGTPVADNWLRVTMQRDAAETAGALETISPDWLIVDHYGLDATWERELSSPGRRILVIDDLADRPHVCDLLLDQTFGRRRDAYSGLVPDEARLLLGADFALLRPEFGALRHQTLVERDYRLGKDLELLRVIVALGGYDEHNVTSRVLDALGYAVAQKIVPPVSVDVVLSGGAVHLASLREQRGRLPFSARIHVDTPYMADLIRSADLAIGAAGTTTWERACLGVPSLLMILADNQTEIAGLMAEAGAALLLASPDAQAFDASLHQALRKISGPGVLKSMARTGAAIVDGAGAERVVNGLMAKILRCRSATRKDSRRVWAWRHAEKGHRWYRNPTPVPFTAHDAWFETALADPTRRLLIVEDSKGLPVAHVRLDIDSMKREGEISIVIAPEVRGTGVGRPVLRQGIWAAEDARLVRLRAEIHAGNEASLHVFKGEGFCEVAKDLSFVHLELILQPAENRQRTS